MPLEKHKSTSVCMPDEHASSHREGLEVVEHYVCRGLSQFCQVKHAQILLAQMKNELKIFFGGHFFFYFFFLIHNIKIK